MAETFSIRTTDALLGRLQVAQFDAQIIVSRLLDGEDASTTIIYANSVVRQLDEVLDLLAEEN